MSFLDHLEELRRRLFRILAAFMMTTIVCLSFSGFFVDLLIAPAKGIVTRLIFLKPAEAFMVHIKVSIIAGIIIASPYIFYQLWLFIAPGLHPHERRWILPLSFVSVVLFISGVCFSYFGVIRFGLAFLMSYATEGLESAISIDAYISMATWMFFTFGLIFQLPLVLIALNQLGLVSVAFLREKRPYAIVIIFIVAAILTPPDVISQMLMAIPLIFLYEVSIWVATLINRARNKEEKAQITGNSIQSPKLATIKIQSSPDSQPTNVLDAGSKPNSSNEQSHD